MKNTSKTIYGKFEKIIEKIQKIQLWAHDQQFATRRLGTFEYIMSNGESSLPSPYQIYLLNSGDDMQICWRYPHPRTINFIQIYPIPGQVNLQICNE